MRILISTLVVASFVTTGHASPGSRQHSVPGALGLHAPGATVFRAQAAQDDTARVTAIQLELNRLGCEAGAADGQWGPGSKRALATYAAKVGEPYLGPEPTDALLQKLRSENGRLCTLPPGVIAGENRSATAHLEAVKYSYSIWSSMPSNVAVQQTEYGTLRCQVGSGSTPRICTWQ